MSTVRNFFVVIFLLIVTVTASAQKLEEMQNSYNYKRGYELLFQDNPDESGALDCFKKEIDEHPKNGYAYYFLGIIYDRNDQEGNALQCCNNAIEYLKKDKEWLPYAYRLRARINLQLNHDNLALDDWKSALKEAPKDVNVLSDRAEYYYNKGEYALSDADYDDITSIAPGNTLGYKGKGRNATYRKDYQKAIDLFSYAITLDPNDELAFANRADAYIRMEKYNEASDDIISALNINASCTLAWNLIEKFKSNGKDIILAKLRIQQAKDKNSNLWSYLQGMVNETNNDFAKAIKSYKASNDITVNDGTLFRISSCYSELGEYNKALDYINRAMVMDTTDTDYLLYKSMYQYENGQNDDALATITTFINKQPDSPDGYYRRAFFEDNLGKVDKAIEDYTTAIVLAPNYAYSYLGRADNYKKKGRNDAAIADYKKVVELDTTYTTNSCAQYALFELGEKDKAKAFQDSVIAHYPDDKGVYYDGACLYCRMGEYDKALANLKLSLEKGYCDFAHIYNDDDLDALKNRNDFKALINGYKQKVAQLEKEGNNGTATEKGGNVVQRISEVPFTRESGGLCKVKCNVNGLPLNFWLDTGASDVSLSMVEATFMMKNGYLSKDDVVGNSYYLDANGNVNEGTVLNLRKVSFGDSELTNVKASVVSNLKAPLLLGQTVLSRLGSVEIDNAKNVIRIKYFK